MLLIQIIINNTSIIPQLNKIPQEMQRQINQNIEKHADEPTHQQNKNKSRRIIRLNITAHNLTSLKQKKKAEILKLRKQNTSQKNPGINKQKQQFDKFITHEITGFIGEYNKLIRQLPYKISKHLKFQKYEEALNPLPFEILFGHLNKIKIQNQNELIFGQLDPYVINCWFKMMDQSLSCFEIFKPHQKYQKSVQKLDKYSRVSLRLCFVIKQILLLTHDKQSVIDIIEKIKKNKKSKLQQMVFEIAYHIKCILEIQIHSCFKIEAPLKNCGDRFLGQLKQLLIKIKFEQRYQRDGIDYKKFINHYTQKFYKRTKIAPFKHYSEITCPQCKNYSITYGVVDVDGNQSVGYQCQLCKWYQQYLKPKEQIQIVDGQLQFTSNSLEIDHRKFLSIQISNKSNNLIKKVQQRFGVNSFSNQVYSSVTIPTYLSSDVVQFSTTTVHQLKKNMMNCHKLPLTIKKSSIPNAGMGVHATQQLGKNRLVMPYIGQYVFADQTLYSDSLYQAGWCEDDKQSLRQILIQPCKKLNAARFINGAPDQKANCKALRGIAGDMQYVLIITKRKILPGQELTYDYGPSYTFEDDFQEYTKLKELSQKLRLKELKEKEQKRLQKERNGQLTRPQLAKLYRQFSRQKYNKYSHQFPRLRQSELVSKIIKEWEALTPQQKVNLNTQYYQNKHLNDDDQQSVECRFTDEDLNLRPKKKQKICQNQAKLSGVQVYCRYQQDDIRRHIRKTLKNVIKTIRTKNKIHCLEQKNGWKIQFLKKQLFKESLFQSKLREFIQDYATILQRCPYRQLLGIKQSSSQDDRQSIKYTGIFHAEQKSDLYYYLLNSNKNDKQLIQQSEQIINNEQSSQNIHQSSNSIIGQPSLQKTALEKTIDSLNKVYSSASYFYTNLRKCILKNVEQYDQVELVLQYQTYFPRFKADFSVLVPDQLYSIQARNSLNQTQKKICRICRNFFAIDRVIGHVKKQHSLLYWTQWVLINFQSNIHLFTETQITNESCGPLQYKVLDATTDFKEKNKKIDKHKNNDIKVYYWIINKGVVNFLGEVKQIFKDINKNQKPLIASDQPMTNQENYQQQKSLQNLQKKQMMVQQGKSVFLENQNSVQIQVIQMKPKQRKQKPIRISFDPSHLKQQLKLCYNQQMWLSSIKIGQQLQSLGINVKFHTFYKRPDVHTIYDVLIPIPDQWKNVIIFYQVPNHFGLLLKTQSHLLSFDGLLEMWPDFLIKKSAFWQQQKDEFSCGYRVLFWAMKISEIGITRWINEMQGGEQTIQSRRYVRRKAKIISHIRESKVHHYKTPNFLKGQMKVQNNEKDKQPELIELNDDQIVKKTNEKQNHC